MDEKLEKWLRNDTPSEKTSFMGLPLVSPGDGSKSKEDKNYSSPMDFLSEKTDVNALGFPIVSKEVPTKEDIQDVESGVPQEVEPEDEVEEPQESVVEPEEEVEEPLEPEVESEEEVEEPLGPEIELEDEVEEPLEPVVEPEDEVEEPLESEVEPEEEVEEPLEPEVEPEEEVEEPLEPEVESEEEVEDPLESEVEPEEEVEEPQESEVEPEEEAEDPLESEVEPEEEVEEPQESEVEPEEEVEEPQEPTVEPEEEVEEPLESEVEPENKLSSEPNDDLDHKVQDIDLPLAVGNFDDRDQKVEDIKDSLTEDLADHKLDSETVESLGLAMVEESQSLLEEEPEAAPEKKEVSGKKRKLFSPFIGAISLILLLSLGGGAFFLLKGDSFKDELSKANSLFGDGNYEEALTLYERLPEDKFSKKEFIIKAELLQKLGRLGEALDSYYSALALSPSNPGIYSLIGDLLVKLKSDNQAKKAYEEALRLDPDNPFFKSALEGLAASSDSFNVLSEDVKSEDLLAVSLSDDLEAVSGEVSLDYSGILSSNDIPAPVELAVKIEDKAVSKDEPVGKSTEKEKKVSEKKIKKVKKKSPPVKRVDSSLDDHFEGLLVSGRKIDTSDSQYMMKLSDKKVDSSVLLSLGRKYRKSGRFKEALLFLDKGLAKDGSSTSLLMEAAYCYFKINRPKESKRLLESVILSGSSFPSDDIDELPLFYSSRNKPSSFVVDDLMSKGSFSWGEQNVLDVPGLKMPSVNLGFLRPLEKAIALNPGESKIYLDYVYVLMNSSKVSNMDIRSACMGLEAHAFMKNGDLASAASILNTAMEISSRSSFLKSLKKKAM